MFGLFRRPSAFWRALEASGLERCSLSGRDLWVGLPPDPNYGRLPVVTAPAVVRSVLFVEGPEQGPLLEAFAFGPEAMTVENLLIGTSHDFIPGHRPPYDFSPAIAILKKAMMPALERLSLGDMELLFNGHGYFGHLGDVTEVLDAAPNLSELQLFGRAEISRPMSHDELQVLSIVADDIAGNCGATASDTVSNILLSDFPKLTDLHLSLEAGEAPGYVIPEAFYLDGHMPALRNIDIDCLTPEHEERLEIWKADQRCSTQDT